MLSFIFYFHKKLKTKHSSLFVFHSHEELKNKLLNKIKIDFMVNSGVDKLLSRRTTFPAHNFACAPDRASNKMDAQKQSIHQRHLQFLAIEVYKSLMHLNLGFMWPHFSEKPLPYNLRNGKSVQLTHVKSYRFGIDSLRFRGSMLWNNLPFSVKNSETLTEF